MGQSLAIDQQPAAVDRDPRQEAVGQLRRLDRDADLLKEESDPVGAQSAATASSTGVSPPSRTNVLPTAAGAPRTAASTRAPAPRGAPPSAPLSVRGRTRPGAR